MTITLTTREHAELWAEAALNSLHNTSSQRNEFLCEVPRQLGKGYVQNIELHPHLWLSIEDCEYYDDVLIKTPSWNHPLQFMVLLSGIITDDYGCHGGGRTLISGSGIQRAMTFELQKSQRLVGVNIHMEPELLGTFFSREPGQIPSEFQLLAKGNDWQTLLYPQITTAIRFLTQQIINCPYQGITKRMYLQGKVLELMALQLAPILADRGIQQTAPRLKSETIARIHHAREIMLSRLENPPSLMELATLVGMSDRTLL
ncbi:AraC family transcriptional regulator [Tolypothrix sp. VBCCA 56010]|uniref:AraC family transcriptional regulator n=1 Tax=Tolypothrix sp. VBCCA 56010 TaxID=3137731 RepID=UPI003D7C4B7E